MKFTKRQIEEKINPEAVANQTKDIVDAVKSELDSDDETAKAFVKNMAVSEGDDDEVANRSIEYGIKEPENGEDINYGEKGRNKIDTSINDLPFESTKKRKVIKTIKVKNI